MSPRNRVAGGKILIRLLCSIVPLVTPLGVMEFAKFFLPGVWAGFNLEIGLRLGKREMLK